MYTVNFEYFDNSNCLCEGINKIKVHTQNGITDILGDDILNHDYKIYKEIYLFSDTRTYTVSCNNLKFIEIRKN